MARIRYPRPEIPTRRARVLGGAARPLLRSILFLALVSLASGSLVAAPAPPASAAVAPGPVVFGVLDADLSVAMSDAPDPVAAGEDVTSTVQVANAGPAAAIGVELTVQLDPGVTFVSAAGVDWNCGHDSGLVTCTRGLLAVESAPAVSLVVTAPAQSGTVTQQAAVTSEGPDPTPDDNAVAEDTTVTASADLSIDKRGPDAAVAGTRIRYTLRVNNAGPSAAEDLVVTDELPPGSTFVSAAGSGWICDEASGIVTCTRGSLAVGVAPGIVIRIDTPSGAGTIVNSASVDAATDDPVDANDDTKSTDLSASADLSMNKTGPASVVAGAPIAYTLTVDNAGPSTATDLAVIDELPAGTTFVSATGNGWTCDEDAGTVTCTRPALVVRRAPKITLTITAEQTIPSIVNTAGVSSAVADPDPSDDADSATTSQARSADLSVGPVSASPDPVRVGSPIAYRFEVANLGPSIATSAELVVDLPSGVVYASAATTVGVCDHSPGLVTCELGELASGEDATVDVVLTPTSPGVKVAAATASHDGDDPVPGNDDGAPASTAQGQACTQIGTQNADTMNGGAGADVICGLAGSDTLGGGDGADLVYAGSGDDEVNGGAGGDSINGQAGDDDVNGDAGFDYARYEGAASGVVGDLTTGLVTGGDGGDTLSGIEGFVGSRFADQLTGNALDNIIEGGRGNDTLDGMGGRDGVSYALASAGVTVSLASGTSSGADHVDTLANFEDLFGSPFNDVLTGDGAGNSIHGLVGNDTIGGGAGFDFARYSSAPSAVTVDLSLGSSSGGHGNDSLSGFEGVAGSAFADTLRGNESGNTLIGGGGADTLNGGGDADFASYSSATGPVSVNLGTDRASGADGNDTLISIEGAFGSAFADTLTGGDANDSLSGLGGADAIGAGTGNDDVWGGTGNDSIAGGGGFDYARYDDAPAGVQVSLRDGDATGGDGSDSLAGFEGVTGSAFPDSIGGNKVDQSLFGRAGADRIAGEKGADDLFGESGDDDLFGGDGADELRGGGGNDALNGGRGTDTCVQGPGSGPKQGCEKSRFAPAAVRSPAGERLPAG